MMISLATSCPDCNRRRSISAFTLTELLVVIGIIALLIAILFPALGRARESANSVKCQAQQRQVLQAMFLHASEHKGYMPLSGWPVVGVTPEALNDPAREKYDYYGTGPGNYQLMSVLGALAPQLGQKIDTQSKATVEAGIQQGIVRQMFSCPSDRDGGRMGSTVWEGGEAYSSYVLNDAVFGWGTSLVYDGTGLRNIPNHHSRQRGKLSSLPRASELFLLVDGAPRSDGGWQLICDADADLSLRDVLVTTSGPPNNPNASNNPPPGRCANWDVIDMARHRKRMNVAFADGHCENVAITEGDLAKISLNKGFPAN